MALSHSEVSEVVAAIGAVAESLSPEAAEEAAADDPSPAEGAGIAARSPVAGAKVVRDHFRGM
jgi:hypothetical protein